VRPDPGLFATPQSSQDVRRQQDYVNKALSPRDRVVRTLLTKVGGSIDRKNAEIASLRAQVGYLTTELEAQKPYTRKRVQINANNEFATIQEIDNAQQASQRPPKKRSRVDRRKPQQLAQEAGEIIARSLE
jgi:hypothetical protein